MTKARKSYCSLKWCVFRRLPIGSLFCGHPLRQHHAAINRFRADPEGSILKLTSDISREVTAGKGVFETTQKVAAAVMPVVGISAGGAGTLSPGAAFIVTASAAVLPLGDALVKAWLPDFYARIKRKF
ncbi:hypothetical protein [Marinibactrum halimedae]|nr:hypothetical protein [Marinibactrum halimedae]MCD9459710.1 hypothetical protein [Marinibactrum halimedae]